MINEINDFKNTPLELIPLIPGDNLIYTKHNVDINQLCGL